MVGQAFLEKLVNYFNEKYKDEEGFKPFKIGPARYKDMFELNRHEPVGKNRTWEINTEWDDGVGIYEKHGDIIIHSHGVGDWEKEIDALLSSAYKPEDDKKHEEMRKEKEKILNDIRHYSWENYLDDKYFEKPYDGFILKFYWNEAVAHRIREEYDVDVEFRIRNHRGFFTSFFNLKWMSEEKIFNEIVKRAEAVRAAQLKSKKDVEGERRFYEEFRARMRLINQEFLEKLVDYFNEKYKDKPSFKPFKIDMRPTFKDRRWEITTEWFEGFGVYESVDGKIVVHSHRVGNWREAVRMMLHDYVYASRFKRARSKEDREKLEEMMHREEIEICSDIANRRWEKYLQEKYLREPYGGFILPLYWGEEVARRIMEEHNVNVIYAPRGLSLKSFFISTFDPSGMSGEQIFNEIVKRAEAVYAAQRIEEWNDKEEKKFYREFKAKARGQEEGSMVKRC